MTGDRETMQRARDLARQAIEEQLREKDPPRAAPLRLVKHHRWTAAGVENTDFTAHGENCLCVFCFRPAQPRRARRRPQPAQMELFR